MKALFLALSLGLALAGNVRAESNLALEILRADFVQTAAVNNLINWKVGEFTQSKMTAAGFGDVGNMKKMATSEQGNGLWVKAETSGAMGSQVVEVLYDRANGDILEYRENGQKKEMPKDKIEIIKQEQATITVPAGTFQTIHVTAKSEKAKSIEMWVNPRDAALDGGIQQKIDTGMIAITMQLTAFGGK